MLEINELSDIFSQRLQMCFAVKYFKMIFNSLISILHLPLSVFTSFKSHIECVLYTIASKGVAINLYMHCGFRPTVIRSDKSFPEAIFINNDPFVMFIH